MRPRIVRSFTPSRYLRARSLASTTNLQTSIDEEEVAKFSAVADEWWDLNGPFRPLHQMSETRVRFVRNSLARHYGLNASAEKPLSGLRVVDVGCGGGLLTEPLAKLGASVVGIDASPANIATAKAHAASSSDEAVGNIEYLATTAEDLMATGRRFDVVCSFEVVEHVAHPKSFAASCSGLTEVGGLVFMSTMNRTHAAYAIAIFAAERALKMVPEGTHEWEKFISPTELQQMLRESGVWVEDVAGMVYNPLTGTWSLSPITLVNYVLYGVKNR